MPSTAAITTGMCSGRQPAITALIATFSAVDRDLPVGDEGDLVLGLEPRRIEHGAHPAFGGRHDGKPIGPALLEAELDGLARIVHGVALG